MPPAEISGAMAEAIGYAMTHGGELVRHKGGHWTYANCPLGQFGIPEWSAPTVTVQALIRLGYFVVVEWYSLPGEHRWRAADDFERGWPIRVRVQAMQKPERWKP